MKVLIADDDPVSRLLLETHLTHWDYDIVIASDGSEAWQVLQAPDPPRLAILDWMMPGMDGPQICRAVRERADARYTYLILLTAKGGKQDIADGMEAGADDYIAKPFAAPELRARLRAGQRIIDLQSELLATLEALHYEATHDSLTRLWNHSAILDILRSELARAEREPVPVSVILADLDQFKSVNDLHGHLAGDAVLREVSRRMRGTVRLYDQIGRYGGEEFLVVLPGCDTEHAAEVAERLRACIEMEPVQIDASTLEVTLSLGLATGDALADESHLLRAADAALYRAKDLGRNRVVTSPPAASASGCRPVGVESSGSRAA